MKVSGINIDVDVDNIVPMVKSLEYPYGSASANRKKNLNVKESLIKIDRISKEIFEKSKAKIYSPRKLNVLNNSLVATIGHAIHCIPESKISVEDLLTKMKSISENGILAIERFGISSEFECSSEVPFRVSFHKVTKESPIKEIGLLSNYESDKKAQSADDIKFFIDFNNPVLKPLKDIDPINILREKAIDKDIYDALLPFGRSSYYTLDDSVALDIIKKTYKEQYSIYSRPVNMMGKMVPGTTESEEEYVETMTKQQIELRKKYAPRIQKNLGFILDGVPSELIVGIKIPNHLRENIEFVSKTSELFPEAVIFDNEGKAIANKNKVAKDLEMNL